MVAAFAGLRASELRGLRWADLDLKSERTTVTVSQRADRYGRIGAPKSATSRRTIPLASMVANTLRQWKLQCPKSDGDLVFPSELGQVQCLSNMARVTVERACQTAKLVDAEGKHRYGLHSLRHAFASWNINKKLDGGLEQPLKVVQHRMGHSNIQLTADTYGHLFPSLDNGADLDAGVQAVFATN